LISVTLFAEAPTVDVCKRRYPEKHNVVVVVGGGGVVISVDVAGGFRDQLLHMKVVKAVPIQASEGDFRAPGY
jgi:hypothetical protein